MDTEGSELMPEPTTDIVARRVEAESRLDAAVINFFAVPDFGNFMRLKSAALDLFTWANAVPEDFPEGQDPTPTSETEPWNG